MQYFLSCEAVLPLIFKQNLLFIIPPIVKKSKYLLIKQKANLSNARSAFSLRNYVLECNIFCNLMQLFITYEGTIAQWNTITKPVNWMSSGEHSYNNYLKKIQCVDGYLEYDPENNVWNEVKNG